MAIDLISGVTPFKTITDDNIIVKDNTTMLESFSDYLKNAIDQTNKLQVMSQKMTNDFVAGKTDNLHEVMIAGEKADVAMQFTMQVRTKILDAYNEIMRMPV